MSLRYKGGVISATPPTVSATSPNAYGTAKGVWTLEQQLQYQGSGTWPSPFTPVYIEDVFSTYLYTGNGSTQTITNNIDLSGKGGMLWIKNRNTADTGPIMDTVRGKNFALRPNATNAQTDTGTAGITAFNSNGFSLGADFFSVNTNNNSYVSWTFREQAKFFDVVTFTGTGAAQQINHNLGSTPGCIIVKNTSNAQAWYVYHRSLSTPANNYLVLNTTAASATISGLWGTVNSTQFGFLGNNGDNYVAYLFAHDAGGFGANGTDNVISCGSYTGNGSATGPTITLGYEPQWVLIKSSSVAGSDWYLLDSMRGMSYTRALELYPNLTTAETAQTTSIVPTATGFQVLTTDAYLNNNTSTYVYIAIRRGPMKTPTSATSVFIPVTYTGDGGVDRFITSGFVSDFAYIRDRNDGTEAFRQNFVQDRLRGGGVSLVTNSTGAEGADTGWTNTDMRNQFQSNTGMLVTVFSNRYNASSKSYVSYQFARAPGFMDVVCYTGTGSNRTVNHNLGVAPELIIVKRRNSSTYGDWYVYNASQGATKFLLLNLTDAVATNSGPWNNTAPTSSVFTAGSDLSINSTATYVAYLFASLTGVSKVGSYTGTGTTLQVNCGFTNGSRFVLIKRTDSTGEWYVWDSARGIVAGNDPYLLLNSTAAEVTNTDYVDTYSAGFEISSTAPAAINANGGTFIFLAIA